jgi:hypothetical protein
MNSLIIRAPFHVRSGYETLIETVCIELNKIGFNIYPISVNLNI